MFKHEFVQSYKLERIDIDGSRFYLTEDGTKLSSVTSILSRYNKEAIDAWRQRVGEQQANQISRQALNRGTSVHHLCEQFLLNNSDYAANAMPINLSDFNKIKQLLIDNVEMVYGVELQLYSKQLKSAGTTDLFCKWNGVNSICDFKTSSKIKSSDQIRHYFIQATVYAIMCEQLYNIKVPQIVIIMIVSHDQPIIFVKNKSEFFNDVAEIFIKGNSNA